VRQSGGLLCIQNDLLELILKQSRLFGRHARIAFPTLSPAFDNSVGHSVQNIEIELAKGVRKRRKDFEDPKQLVTIHQRQNHH